MGLVFIVCGIAAVLIADDNDTLFSCAGFFFIGVGMGLLMI